MRKLSNKRLPLLVAVLGVLACAVPATASAGAWTSAFGTYVLDGLNPADRLSFTLSSGAGWTCGTSQFDIDIASSSDGRITAAGFQNCMGTGPLVNCTVTPTAQKLPWTVTNPLTTNIRFFDVHENVAFENTPGNPSACAQPTTVTVTGNLNSGEWDNVGHELVFNDATGLLSHAGGTSLSVSVTGTLRDTSRTLTMAD